MLRNALFFADGVLAHCAAWCEATLLDECFACALCLFLSQHFGALPSLGALFFALALQAARFACFGAARYGWIFGEQR